MNFISARGNRIAAAVCAVCAFVLTGRIEAAFASGSASGNPASSSKTEGATREIGAVTTLRNMCGSQMRVCALISAAPGNAVSRGRIEIDLDPLPKNAGEFGERGFIDYDQAKTVIGALDIMQQTAAQAASDPEEQTRFHFTTRRGVEIGFFQTGDKTTAYIEVNHRRRDFAIERVSDLERAIQRAADTLNSDGTVVSSLAAR